MGRFIDLTNMKFERLTVIRRTDDYIQPNGRHITMWLCKCECGNDNVIIRANSIISGNTKSCGCLHNEKSIVNIKKCIKANKNNYNLSGDYGIGYTNNGEIFYFDIEDYKQIKDYCWFKTENKYIRAKIKGTQKHIFLHKVICDDFNDELIIDHRNGKKYDCRKINLRIADASKNNMNKNLQKNNSSGVVGVIWHKRDSIWEAYISINNRRIYLGRYNDFEEAAKIRREAEACYFGEWSYTKSRTNK